jgi:cyclophilin family peptidyl-prolyl cis-trans isomerase
MTASPGASSASTDEAWPEPAQWLAPEPQAALLPPLSQPRLMPVGDVAAFVPSVTHTDGRADEIAQPGSGLAPELSVESTPALMAEPVLTGEPQSPTDLSEPVIESSPTVVVSIARSAPVSNPPEPVAIQIADAPPTKPASPRRKRSRLAVALIDAIGILLVIGAIALIGKGLSDRRNGGSNGNNGVTSVATSIDPNAPPPTVPGRSISGITRCPNADGSESRATSFQKSPPLCIDTAKRYRATIVTNRGSLNLTLDAANAPMTVNNFVVLARYHFFDSTVCPRIIPAYLFQCGDPTGKGTGGPGYTFPDELPSAGEYKPGSIAMATSSPDTNGSQFFIVLGADGVALPPKYSLFGTVDPGQEALLALLDAAGTEQGTPTKELVSIQAVVVFEE